MRVLRLKLKIQIESHGKNHWDWLPRVLQQYRGDYQHRYPIARNHGESLLGKIEPSKAAPTRSERAFREKSKL